MKPIKLIVLSALSVGFGVGAAFVAAPLFHEHAALAQTQWAYEYQSLDQMVADADAVVLGKVVNTQASRVVPVSGGNALLPFTYVDVEVIDALKGDLAGIVTFEQTGGRINEQETWLVGEGGPYARGSRVLLFLKEQGDSGIYIVSHPKGRFEVAGERLLAARPDDKVAAALHGLTVGEAKAFIAAFQAR